MAPISADNTPDTGAQRLGLVLSSSATGKRPALHRYGTGYRLAQ